MSSTIDYFSQVSAGLLLTIIFMAAESVGFAQVSAARQPKRAPSSGVTAPLAETPTDFAAILRKTGRRRNSQVSSVIAHQVTQPTEESLEAILDHAAQIAEELEKVDKKEKEELGPRIMDWKRRLDIHNGNPCTYPKGHPETCAWYDTEAAELDAEGNHLRTALRENDDQRRRLKDKLGILKARLRVEAMLVFKCKCNGLSLEEEKACWDQCIDRVDPRLKSCLHIADLELYALCLRRA